MAKCRETLFGTAPQDETGIMSCRHTLQAAIGVWSKVECERQGLIKTTRVRR